MSKMIVNREYGFTVDHVDTAPLQKLDPVVQRPETHMASGTRVVERIRQENPSPGRERAGQTTENAIERIVIDEVICHIDERHQIEWSLGSKEIGFLS